MPNPRSANPQRVLILDNSPVVTAAIAKLLGRTGLDVYETQNPADAWGHLDAADVQILIADLAAVGLPLVETLRQLRQRSPRTVTILLNQYASVNAAVDATAAGAVSYLTKPINPAELLSAVEKAVRRGTLLADASADMRPGEESTVDMAGIIGQGQRMRQVFELVDAVADSRTTVLIVGESGTGKSMLARAIHRRSTRRAKPFVELSCGALSETLLDSELFGHVKGSFTGADTDRPGRFSSAHEGTIFLDEVNSAPPSMQVKLLRVLQEKCFEPVGSHDTQTVDVRCILATNADLRELVAAGKFRQDLFYRINVVAVELPPLRERPGDIPLLVAHFVRRFSKESNRNVVGVSESALKQLSEDDWPGNVRELENAIERAVLLCRRPTIDVEDLPDTLRVTRRGSAADVMAATTRMIELPDLPLPLEKAMELPEKRIIHTALERNNWNRQSTASELAINRTTLYKKMRKYGLDAGDFN